MFDQNSTTSSLKLSVLYEKDSSKIRFQTKDKVGKNSKSITGLTTQLQWRCVVKYTFQTDEEQTYYISKDKVIARPVVSVRIKRD